MKFAPTIYTDDCEVSMLFMGEPYFIRFEIEYDDAMPVRCHMLDFCLTKQSLDEIKWPNLPHKRLWYVKWGGYPIFIQNEVNPISDDGRPYVYLCTVNNEWGDSGNCNIFILVRKGELGYEVEDVYMEYSCC